MMVIIVVIHRHPSYTATAMMIQIHRHPTQTAATLTAMMIHMTIAMVVMMNILVTWVMKS